MNAISKKLVVGLVVGITVVGSIGCTTAPRQRKRVAVKILLQTTAAVDSICEQIGAANGRLPRSGDQSVLLPIPDTCKPVKPPTPPVLKYDCLPEYCTCVADDFNDSLNMALAGLCKYDSWSCDDKLRCSCFREGCILPGPQG